MERWFEEGRTLMLDLVVRLQNDFTTTDLFDDGIG